MSENTLNPVQVELDLLSRYRNSRIYIDEVDITFIGTWRAPPIRQTLLPTVHVVAPEEVTRPDLIAYRVYGDPSLFWPIAIRNNIFMPLRDIQVGQALVCPHIDDVTAALSQSSQTSAGTT